MVTHSSPYKKLLVSGCSFTAQSKNANYPFSWANVLAARTGMDVINLAVPGAGNSHISNSIILYLERNKLNLDETLILIMWTGPSRFDWITDKDKSNGNSYSFSYYYDDYNELTVAGNWLRSAYSPKSHKTHLTETMVQYSKYQSESSLALQSWLAITNLNNYLKLHKYKFYQTTFLDLKENPVYKDALPIHFYKELDKLNLTLDKTSWLKLQNKEYYGEWAKANKCLMSDHFHPNCPEASEKWVDTVLIPQLEIENIIFKLDSQ